MKIFRATAIGALCGVAAAVSAQNQLMQPGFVAGGPAAVLGTADATQPYGRPGESSNFVNAYGDPYVAPASYCGPGGGCGPMGGCGQMGGCGPMGGGGGMGGPGMGSGPGGGYMNTEQCGPHYFDVGVEYLFYSREDSALDDVIVSTASFAPDEALTGLDAASRLRTGQLGTDDLNGYRLTGRIDVGALSVFEVAYSGMYSGSDSASAVPADATTARLFSIFSRYGLRTNGGVGSQPGTPLGTDFQETDFASLHEIEAESELHNVEALFRRYWVGYNPRVSGTILLGFRYTSLSDRLGFRSIGSEQITTGPDEFAADLSKQISINTEADNRLSGFEVGGDAWVTVLQGLRIGSEAKVGIYNNNYQMSASSIAADGSPNTVTNSLSGNQVAFLTEFKAMAVADISSCVSIKAGYELLFISDLASMGDGLTFANPYGPVDGLTGTGASTNGEAFFHGFHAGIEYIW